MIRISAFLPGSDERSQLARLNDAENQRNAWLRQMELAQLSEMGKLGVLGDTNGRDAGSGNGAQQKTTAGYNGAGAMAGAQVMRPAQATAAYTASQSGRTESDSTSGEPDSANSDGAGLRGAPRNADLMPAAAPLVAQTMEGMPATSLLSPGLASVTSAIAGSAGAPQSLPEQQSAPVMLQAVQPRAGASMAAPGAAGRNEKQEAAQEQTAREESSGAESAQEEQPVWGKRLIHLTSEGRNVDVWIRDSALNPRQSAGLVSRLAGDIAGTGMRLRGATVNGKPIFRSGTPTARERPRASPVQHAQQTGSTPSAIAQSEEDHGA